MVENISPIEFEPLPVVENLRQLSKAAKEELTAGRSEDELAESVDDKEDK